ncbi:cadherin-related family member 4-like [Erpetoichthys calabaricus]|uniref:cadherin-related family member 4-like n=1 Tax=Erpetoichthys calabaricus TaxID=27687 RepID=UPI002234AB7A|nr:cadherin-related family member 4-like [Erpetoichthys calabaricus]
MTNEGDVMVLSGGLSSNKIYKLTIAIHGFDQLCKGDLFIKVLPIHFVNFTKPTYFATVHANSGPLAHVITLDVVKTEGMLVFFTILTKQDSFQITHDTGEMTTTYNFDNQSPVNKRHFLLNVTVCNMAYQVNDTALVNITVLNVKDIPPSCNPAVIMRTVTEQQSLHFNLNCTAYDGTKKNLCYKIVSETSSAITFKMDKENVEVNTAIQCHFPENRNTTYVYSAVIIVNDTRNPALSTYVKVYISVIPVQHQLQCITSNIKVQRTTLMGTVVDRVNVTDVTNHHCVLNRMWFRVINKTPSPSAFFIDPRTGFIHLMNNLEHETQTVFSLTLHVSVYRNTPNVSICTITILVEETLLQCNSLNTYSILSTTPPGTLVFTPHCSSPSTLSFHIVGGNINEKFYILPITDGTIYTTSPFSYDLPGVIDPTSFELLVQVKEEEFPHRSVTLTVIIHVTLSHVTTVTTTQTTKITTRTTEIITLLEYYWLPDTWFIIVMIVFGVLLLLMLFIIWKASRSLLGHMINKKVNRKSKHEKTKDMMMKEDEAVLNL